MRLGAAFFDVNFFVVFFLGFFMFHFAIPILRDKKYWMDSL